jgi:hypothetical protein
VILGIMLMEQIGIGINTYISTARVRFIVLAECAWQKPAIKGIAAGIFMVTMLQVSTIKLVTSADSRRWMLTSRNTSSLDIIIKIYYNIYRK